MFVRLFFVFRTLAHMSTYNDVYSKALCRKYSVDSSWRFVIKCNLVLYPEHTFTTALIFIVILFSYEVRIYELPFQQEIQNLYGSTNSFFNAFWLVSCTITTVGYGD